MSEIEILLVNKYNELIEKLEKGNPLDEADKRFIEETFLNSAFDDCVYKEYEGEKDLMYDILAYFKKYPIENISNPRNIQLSILYVLSNKMINIPGNSAISFNFDSEERKPGEFTLGSFGQLSDGTPYIRIDDLDKIGLESVRIFLEKMFTVYHEFRHFLQKYDEPNSEFKEIIEMERCLVRNNRPFYDKYHDSFYLEWDADSYASTELIKEYGEQYQDIVYNIVSRKEEERKRIDWPTFYLMELDEYGKNPSQQGKKNTYKE